MAVVLVVVDTATAECVVTDNGESSAHMYVHHQADPCSQHTSSMQFSANVLGHLVTLFTDSVISVSMKSV